jgi:hypothetical protein
MSHTSSNNLLLGGIGAAVLYLLITIWIDLQTPLQETLQRPLYELGMREVVGPLNAVLMNGLGHIATGALILLFALGVHRATERSGLFAASALLLAGIFWGALGVIPARYGDKAALVNHSLLLIGFQLVGTLALLLLAWNIRTNRNLWINLFLTVCAAALFASILSWLGGLPVPGLLERLGIGAYFVGVGLQSLRWSRWPRPGASVASLR